MWLSVLAHLEQWSIMHDFANDLTNFMLFGLPRMLTYIAVRMSVVLPLLALPISTRKCRRKLLFLPNLRTFSDCSTPTTRP